MKKQFAQACEAQPEQCQTALQASCPLFGEQAAVCLQIFTPCCAQFTDCDVNPGIACMITALAAQQQQM